MMENPEFSRNLPTGGWFCTSRVGTLQRDFDPMSLELEQLPEALVSS